LDIQTYIFYGIAVGALGISFSKSKTRTLTALKKARKSFENILPQLLGVILIIGFLLAILDADVISKIIGEDSGWFGVVTAALVGSITLLPPYVAFPTASMLLDNGAGYVQIAAFISTLMLVGVATMPVEMKYFGKKLTILRNLYGFLFSFLVAIIIGMVVNRG